MTPPPAVRSTPRSTSISSAPRLNRTSVGGVAHDFGAASSHHRRTPQGERLSTPGPSFHLFSTDPVIESPTSNPAPMASAPYSNLIDMTSGAQQILQKRWGCKVGEQRTRYCLVPDRFVRPHIHAPRPHTLPLRRARRCILSSSCWALSAMVMACLKWYASALDPGRIWVQA
ncbi:hypothetical protein C2E23DRAFT_810999 [Lenzites betulinus]|nr:hypothetical protein C2E23DRAFT_810999 [Lenzites betulinus]